MTIIYSMNDRHIQYTPHSTHILQLNLELESLNSLDCNEKQKIHESQERDMKSNFLIIQ